MDYETPFENEIFFSQRSKSEVVVVCVFSDRMTWRLPMVFSLPRRRLDSDVSSLCSSVACAFSGRAHCQAPRQFECVFSDRLNVVARARGWRASFLIASTHRVTGRANVFFLTVCMCLVPVPGRENGSGSILTGVPFIGGMTLERTCYLQHEFNCLF